MVYLYMAHVFEMMNLNCWRWTTWRIIGRYNLSSTTSRIRNFELSSLQDILLVTICGILTFIKGLGSLVCGLFDTMSDGEQYYVLEPIFGFVIVLYAQESIHLSLFKTLKMFPVLPKFHHSFPEICVSFLLDNSTKYWVISFQGFYTYFLRQQSPR